MLRRVEEGVRLGTLQDAALVHEQHAMRDLVRDGMTLVVVTHEMGFAREVAHRVLFMDQGRILERAEPHEFFNHPQHPRARQFLADIRTPFAQAAA